MIDVLQASDLIHANDVSPSIHDEPLLSDGTIHYLGQPIFLVIAKSHIQARKAAGRAKISYHKDSPILSIEDALAANSRFEEGPRIWNRGDLKLGFEHATKIIEGSIGIGGQELYLEGQAALALPQEDDEMVVHSSTQHPTEVQHKVAEALGSAISQYVSKYAEWAAVLVVRKVKAMHWPGLPLRHIERTNPANAL